MEVENKLFIESFLEHETLVRLISITQNLISKKGKLLEMLDIFYDIADRSGGTKMHEMQFKSFKEHHAWLHLALDRTNELLDVSLVHLQVLYGCSFLNRYVLSSLPVRRNR